MRSVRSTGLNVGSNPTVGAIFSAMKAEYVVAAEQAHPLGPAYSFPSLHLFFYGDTHIMIVACPSLAFVFMLLLISHAIITGFACIYCILFLHFLALSSTHTYEVYYIHMRYITYI